MNETKDKKPIYEVGLLAEDRWVGPAYIEVPDGFPMKRCYRMNPDKMGGDPTDAANAHLLAACGNLKTPFVPVRPGWGQDASVLAELPTITKVEVASGEVLHEGKVWCGKMTCVESITITVHTSDGWAFSSQVPMAVAPPGSEGACKPYDVLITPEARNDGLEAAWYLLGGISDQGDTEDTEQERFDEEWCRFWAAVDGPDEPLRLAVLKALQGIEGRPHAVTASSTGVVTVRYEDGREKTIKPPAAACGPARHHCGTRTCSLVV